MADGSAQAEEVRRDVEGVKAELRDFPKVNQNTTNLEQELTKFKEETRARGRKQNCLRHWQQTQLFSLRRRLLPSRRSIRATHRPHFISPGIQQVKDNRVAQVEIQSLLPLPRR
jgi:hypothetical protein